MIFPNMHLVKQRFPDRQLLDITGSIRATMGDFFTKNFITPGAKIAIAVGSRGINNNAEIVRAVVSSFKDYGCHPFIFPSMGSHGNATADGQRVELETRGITESSVGCPIISSMRLTPMGETPEGIPTYMDRTAHDCGQVFVINRIKWHTDFEGPIESGLMKMIAIGLGKDRGAKMCHMRAYEHDGLGSVIRSVARHLLQSKKIIGGLAILEDAHNSTAHVAALTANEIEREEIKLLARVKEWKGNIPVPLDLLIVDEIGKNISGPGMDTKVINRNTHTGDYNRWDNVPWVGRIYARSLHPNSKGNGMGIGLTDIVHDQLIQAIDIQRTRENAMTAQTTAAVQIPMFHYPTDFECLTVALTKLISQSKPTDAKVGWVQNTMNLSLMALSENLVPLIKDNPNLSILGPARPLAFDSKGQLAWHPFFRFLK